MSDHFDWLHEIAHSPGPPPGRRRESRSAVDSIFTILCGRDDETIPAGERLPRPLIDMHWVKWLGEDSVEFHLPPAR
jgi:hypothetical protein